MLEIQSEKSMDNFQNGNNGYVNYGYGGIPTNNIPTPPPKKHHIGVIVAVIFLTLAVLIGGFFVFYKMKNQKDMEQAESVIEDFFDAYEDQDLDDMSESYHNELQNYSKEKIINNYGSEENYWEYINSSFGENFKVTYEIEDKKKLSQDEISDIIKAVEKEADVRVDVKKVYAFKVQETFKGSNGSQTQVETIVVAEENQGWGILLSSLNEVTEVNLTTTEVTTTETYTEETTETTEVITEATTEVATTEASIPITTGNTGVFDWSAMGFAVKGANYNMTSLTYKDIESMGFYADDALLSQDVDNNQYSYSESAKAADGSYVYIRFKNFSGNGTKKARDCEILGITLFHDDYSNLYEASLQNGITFGMSYDQITAIMGTATDTYISEDGSYQTLEYEENPDDIYPNKVKFSLYDGKLTEIEMECYQ